MAGARKVPMHRGGGGARGGAGRAAPHPGTGGSTKPTFQSPYQPPPGSADLAADTLSVTTDDWQVVHVCGEFWRVKTPSSSSLGLLAEIVDSKGAHQVKTVNMFLAAHMHPEDMARMLERMIDPEDVFGPTDYTELYRSAVTVGTARPFSRSSASPAPPPTDGESFAQSLLWEGWRSR